MTDIEDATRLVCGSTWTEIANEVSLDLDLILLGRSW